LTILPHEKQIVEYEEMIEELKKKNKKETSLWTNDEITHMETKLQEMKENIYKNLKAWDRVAICRHPQRPHSLDFITNMCDSFEELHGDRSYQDDHAIVGGIGTIKGEKFVLIGLEKGNDTEQRLYRNFGMAHPEGYRKALRLMQLAEKFHLPVVTLLDTQGAFPGLTAEERGQGWAIAKNLFEMAQLKTPIIVVIIGEGCSGGALGIGVGDTIGMLEHAYYSVISPEGCASILWEDPSKNSDAAEALKIHAEDLFRLKVIDKIIKEPLGGAHKDPAVSYANVKEFILQEWDRLKYIPEDQLVQDRYLKFRKMGKFANISV
jgi:acetyl-CoA carboxylase carboxyl transferase subunit alpha